MVLCLPAIIMSTVTPECLAVIAGKGIYPQLLAESARKQGVKRIVVLAFRGETSRRMERLADETTWVRLGQLQQMLDVLRDSGAQHVVMAGQVTPTALFHVRPDRRALALLTDLKLKNAHSIFGAVADQLTETGMELLPAHLFMEHSMAPAGQLSQREPTARQKEDIELGIHVASTTSGLDIGQTVVMKDGAVVAVEAFEGTDETIRRAKRLAGADTVVVKVAKSGHDMRFDIPVIGLHTMRLLRRVRAAALAVEANRTILLQRDLVIAAADRMNLAVVGIEMRS